MFENLNRQTSARLQEPARTGQAHRRAPGRRAGRKSAKRCSTATSTWASPTNFSRTSATRRSAPKSCCNFRPTSKSSKSCATNSWRLLGKHAKPLFASRPPSVWMIVGLQGSGKTTTTGKLGKWLGETWPPPASSVSTDVYRPAAREQLAQVAKAVGVKLWPGAGTDKPLEIVRGAIREAKLSASRRDPGGHRRPPAHRRRR